MTDAAQPSLDLAQPAPMRRRGRPHGARNRRSADLARWVEATYGGMTPGQQAAELAMVKPADLKKAKALAAELQIVDLGLDAVTLAMLVKAALLAKALGISRAEGWVLLARERVELMPYIHQRQPQAAESKAKPPAMAFMIPEGQASGAAGLLSFDDDAPIEIVDDLPTGGRPVGQGQSDGQP
jgi:hypothetical protein